MITYTESELTELRQILNQMADSEDAMARRYEGSTSMQAKAAAAYRRGLARGLVAAMLQIDGLMMSKPEEATK